MAGNQSGTMVHTAKDTKCKRSAHKTADDNSQMELRTKAIPTSTTLTLLVRDWDTTVGDGIHCIYEPIIQVTKFTATGIWKKGKSCVCVALRGYASKVLTRTPVNRDEYP